MVGLKFAQCMWQNCNNLASYYPSEAKINLEYTICNDAIKPIFDAYKYNNYFNTTFIKLVTHLGLLGLEIKLS